MVREAQRRLDLDRGGEPLRVCVPTTASGRVIRGGDFIYPGEAPSLRDYTDPSPRVDDLGFRCARTP